MSGLIRLWRVTALTNSFARSPIRVLERLIPMLLPSILQMFERWREQPEAAVHPDVPAGIDKDAADKIASEPDKGELEIGKIPEASDPPSLESQPWDILLESLYLEELLRAVAKFEKQDQSRFLDVFE
jgi:hypothetical protein